MGKEARRRDMLLQPGSTTIEDSQRQRKSQNQNGEGQTRMLDSREGIGRAQFHMTLMGTFDVKPAEPIKRQRSSSERCRTSTPGHPETHTRPPDVFQTQTPAIRHAKQNCPDTTKPPILQH